MPKILYVIGSRQKLAESLSAASLKRGCEAEGLEYRELHIEDIGLDEVDNLLLEPGSLLYRVGTQPKAAILESALLLSGRELVSIYKAYESVPSLYRSFSEIFVQNAAGLRAIPTKIIDETWQLPDRQPLESKVQEIGGFPIVVKRLGLSHGQGVTKIDSVDELASLLGAETFETYELIARKYLSEYRHFRLIVVDSTVLAIIEYHKPANDFRTNAAEIPEVTAVAASEVDDELIAMAVKAVELRGSLVGGVDILLDQSDGLPYLAEVNVPCNFSRAEAPTGIEIGSAIVQAMLRKA
jgi:biotin carboxylase